MLVSVDVAKFPQHEAMIRQHAMRWVHGGQTAQMDDSVWNAIHTGSPVPQPPCLISPAELAVVEVRRAVCEGCEHKKELLKLTVKCALCRTCSGVSLLAGKCPAKPARW